MSDQMIQFVMDRQMTPIKIDRTIHVRGANPGQIVDNPRTWFNTVAPKSKNQPKKYSTKNYLKQGHVDQEWINKIKDRTLRTEQRKRQKEKQTKTLTNHQVNEAVTNQSVNSKNQFSANHPVALTIAYGGFAKLGAQVGTPTDVSNGGLGSDRCFSSEAHTHLSPRRKRLTDKEEVQGRPCGTADMTNMNRNHNLQVRQLQTQNLGNRDDRLNYFSQPE